MQKVYFCFSPTLIKIPHFTFHLNLYYTCSAIHMKEDDCLHRFDICVLYVTHSSNTAKENTRKTRLYTVFVKQVFTTRYAMSLLCQEEVRCRTEKHLDWLLSQTQQPIMMMNDSLGLRKHRNWLLSLHCNPKLSLASLALCVI